MSYAGYSFTLLAIICTAVTVRLMDDFLDIQYDSLDGSRSVAAILGDATLPYALITFAAATLINAKVSGTLFLGAYAVGMAGDLRRPLPLGLRGYQEGIAALLLGVLAAGLPQMLWGFCVMLAIQCYDDFLDQRKDAASGNPNLCKRLGTGEVLMAGTLGLMIATYLDFRITALTFGGALISEVLWHLRTGNGTQVRILGGEER